MKDKELLKNIILFVLIMIVLAGCIKGVKLVLEGDREEPTEATTTELTTELAVKTTSERTTEGTTVSTEQTTEHTSEISTEEITETATEELTAKDDTTAPVFLTFTKNVELKQGNVFDVHNYVGYADDIDRAPELTVEGEVDTSVPGTYFVTLTVTDEAGHATRDTMTVNVVTEFTPSSPRSKEDFETFSANYKNDNTVLGIDVSRWQENIDFAKVKEAGCDFVIIRIGGYDDGSQYEDKYYRTNIRGAKAAGLQVGIYWHAEESSVEEVKSNVAYMMGILDGEKLDFPIAYDWEDFSGFEKYNMNLHDINTCFESFCEEVQSYGYEACIYSSKNFLENVWTNENHHPVWLAHYTDRTTYEGDYYMWQQGSTGRIAGIDTDVDFDIWYKD
ncbi:MAG: DUF5011 domain-containing protein [Lachnospiraceae bacterium]|nr:DUF5011 domain-containing protein [Lachnospiraceae bacterium]